MDSPSAPPSAPARAPLFNASKLWLVLVGAAFLVYLPNLDGDRVWDDSFLIGSNQLFRSPLFVFEVFRHWLYPETISVYYRPVQNLSYILDYWLWNENTAGYHLSNILYHGLSGCLLFAVLRQILKPLLEETQIRDRVGEVAFLLSLLWVVHPIHHAAVAYIAGRADSLASLLMLSGWLAYLRAAKCTQAWTRILLCLLAGGLAFLGLCAKEVAVAWLALFACWTLFFDWKTSGRRKLLTLLSVVVVLGGYWLARSLLEPREAAPGPAGGGWPGRIMLMLRALGDYSRLIIFPSDLHMERTIIASRGYKTAEEWQAVVGYEYLAVLGALVLAGSISMLLRNTPGRRLRLFGFLWFLIGFLPISNLIPLVATVAEHWIYMPSIGALLFLAGCLAGISPRWHRPLAYGLGAAVIALGIRTAVKVQDWRDSETFYRKTLEATGGSARIRMNLALVYVQRGDLAEGERLLRDALKVYPEATSILTNLGVVLVKQGRSKEAESYFAAARVGKGPKPNWNLVTNEAKGLFAAGQKQQALERVLQAQPEFPSSWELRALESSFRSRMEGPQAGIAPIEGFIKTHWWSYHAHLVLGECHKDAGNFAEAIQAWEQAARLDIHAGEPFTRIATLQASMGQFEQALAAAKRAIGRQPERILPYVRAAGILQRLGRDKEAAQMREMANARKGDAVERPPGELDPG